MKRYAPWLVLAATLVLCTIYLCAAYKNGFGGVTDGALLGLITLAQGAMMWAMKGEQ